MSESTRRVALRDLPSSRAQHAGLWLDKFLKHQERKTPGATAVDPADRETPRHQLMREAAHIPLPASYRNFFARWETTLAELPGVARRYAHAAGRVIVGLGGENPSETAITLHHTFGVPYLPGSALKGLTAFYARNYLQDAGWRLHADGKVGEGYRTLFGDTTQAGCVTFYDAYYVPDSAPHKQALHTDTITVHHQAYYQGKNEAPADWDKPTPVPFVSAAGVYLVALGGRDAAWVEAGLTILEMALAELGIGAKTSSGYGRMWLDQSLTATRAPIEAPPVATTQKTASGASGTPAPGSSARLRGKIVNVKGRYAFIQPDHGGKTIFVHENALREQDRPLREGQIVEYAVGPGKQPGQIQAQNVRVVG